MRKIAVIITLIAAITIATATFSTSKGSAVTIKKARNARIEAIFQD